MRLCRKYEGLKRVMMDIEHLLLMLLCILLVSLSAISEEVGDLRIICKPGVQIYIDDQVAGVTTEQDGGLLVHGISPGIHLPALKGFPWIFV